MVLEEVKMVNTTCFHKYARPVILTWFYIKMILILCLMFVPYKFYWIVGILSIFVKEINSFIIWITWIWCVIALSFGLMLILGIHLRELKVLKVCFYYLIIELIAAIMITPWAAEAAQYEYKEMSIWLVTVVTIFLLIVQGVLSMVMVKFETKNLSDVYSIAPQEIGYKNVIDDKQIITESPDLSEKMHF